MTLWKRILSAVVGRRASGLSPEQHPSVATARPAPRPYTETELRLLAVSIGRATHGSFG